MGLEPPTFFCLWGKLQPLGFPTLPKAVIFVAFSESLRHRGFPTRKHGPDDSSRGNQVHQNRLSKDQRPPHLCANYAFKYVLSSKLGGVSKYVLFSPLPGEIIQFEGYRDIFLKWVEATNYKSRSYSWGFRVHMWSAVVNFTNEFTHRVAIAMP